MVRPDTPLPAESYWVVVADEYQAIFYARKRKFSPLEQVSSLHNESARDKTGALLADKGGRSFDSFGQGRHTMAREKASPKTQVAVAFAKKVAEGIGEARRQGEFDRLVIIAAPRFLGILRRALTSVGIEPDQTLAKEVTARGADFIRKLVDGG